MASLLMVLEDMLAPLMVADIADGSATGADDESRGKQCDAQTSATVCTNNLIKRRERLRKGLVRVFTARPTATARKRGEIK